MSSAPNTLRFPAAAPSETSAAASTLPHQANTAALPRMPGLDWLRAGAALAVVALHAGIPYMTHPLPSLEWCVRSSEQSATVDALCWAINVVVMPTFFLMGGALAAGVWQRNPGKAFLVHRTRRLLVPLAFAVLVVLPADMYVWLIGWFTQGLIPWRKVLSIKLPAPLSQQFWGVAHLWYLECLWTLSVLAYAAMAFHAKSSRHHTQIPATVSPGSGKSPTQLLIVLAAGLFLSLDPTFLIGFQQTWWPGPAAIAFYGVFFAAGWVQFRERPSAATAANSHPGLVIHLPPAEPLTTEYSTVATRALNPSTRPSPTTPRPRLLFAAGLFALLLPQIHRHVEAPFSGLNLFALTTAYAACSWLAATGLFALARSFKAASIPRPVAFTAEASFWLYLVHHPLVGLTQLAMLNASLSPAAKFLMSLTAGIGLSLASYAVIVRGTWIGQLLDGRGRTKLVQAPSSPAIPEASPSRRAA
jgi:peptidoglycan/LPS O-acetylase OafA/YrhL